MADGVAAEVSLYRDAKEDDAYSVTDAIRLTLRRAWGFTASAVPGAVAVVSAYRFVLAGLGGFAESGGPILLVSLLAGLLCAHQLRDVRRLVQMRIAREYLVVVSAPETLHVPWSDVLEARAGRRPTWLVRDVAGFLAVRFSRGGRDETRYTVCPGREAAAATAEEISRRARAARGISSADGSR